MTNNPEEKGTLNEWLFDEYIRIKDALADLARRHEEIVNHLADVCRRNDKMQAAGNELRDLLALRDDELPIQKAIQDWTEAST